VKLALFDFDGTIIRVDSLIKFIRFVKGDLKTAWGIFILSPILVLYKLKIIPNYRAKQWLLSYFLKGMNEQDFLTISTEFSLHHIDSYVRPKAIERILWHKQQGHKVVVQ
jgi:phosphatidylglycerophosphatase C